MILIFFYILRHWHCDHVGMKQESITEEENCEVGEQEINAEEFVYFSNKVEM